MITYDHVAQTQLWDPMPALPRTLPRLLGICGSAGEDAGKPALPPPPSEPHAAVSDARYDLTRWRGDRAAPRGTAKP